MTSSTGSVTDTYDYDAFDNLLHITGTSPNVYRFAGEQWDPDLNVYYNRARYLNTSEGRFITMDTFAGDPESPLSLHRYLYAAADPVNAVDPSGRDFDLGSLIEAVGDLAQLGSDLLIQARTVLTTVYLTLAPEFPVLIARAGFYLALSAGALSVGQTALEALASSVQNNVQPFPAGNFPRGIAVGRAAQQNLGDTFPIFDNFVLETGEGTQIYSTTQVQTPEALVAAIRAKAQAFQSGFESRDIFAGKNAAGQFERFAASDVKTRNMLVVTSPIKNFSISSIAADIEKVEAEYGLDEILIQESEELAPIP